MADSVELSTGFFQKFHEGTVPPGFQPVLQIIEARSLTGPQSSYRVRLSDGLFSYSACGVSMTLRDRFYEDGLTEHNGIIQITEYKTNEGAKRSLTVANYVVLTLDSPVIGNPQSHTGRAQDYIGIQNMQLGVKAPLKRPGSPDNGSDRQPLRKRALSGNVGSFERTEIALITPYINKWRVCGIVSGKENIKNVKSARGEWRVFSFIVTDQNGNSIKVTGFGEQAEKFSPLVQNDQTYYISGGGPGSVKTANKQYNSTGHDYELMLGRESEVTLSNDMQIDQPKFRINIVPLSHVVEHVNECIDILAIIDRAAELTQVITRAEQKQLDKRELFLVDSSNTEVSLTLWGEQAADFDKMHVGQAIGIKGALVKEFNGGVSLTITSGAVIKYNPEGNATNKLYNWNASERASEMKSVSATQMDSAGTFERDLRLIGVAMQHHLGRDSEVPVYFNVKAMVTQIKTEQAIYQGCLTEGCKKKVIFEGSQFRCEKCNTTFDTCKNIMMLQMEIADFSGTAWITLFDDKATPLLGNSGDQLAQLRREDVSLYDAAFDKIRFHEFNVRVRVKYDMYNDQQQMRWTAMDMKPVLYDKCKKIFGETIQKCERLVG